MNTQKLNDWMQIVGIFALVASIVFVGFQLRQSQEIAMSQAFQSRADSTLSMFMEAAQNPQFVSAVAKFQFGEKQAMTPEERVVLHQYSRGILIAQENMHYQYINGFMSDERRLSAREELKTLLEGIRYPLPFRNVYMEVKASFDPAFQEYIDEIIREIDSEGKSE